MRPIAPPTGPSVKKNSIPFSSKSIGPVQPPPASAVSFDDIDSGPKLIQPPVFWSSTRAAAK